MYKLSIVVVGRHDIGGIQNLDREPKSGDIIALGKEKYEIIDVTELMPPRGEFSYLHAICQPVTTSELHTSGIPYGGRAERF